MNLPILAYAAGISTAVPFLIGLWRMRGFSAEFKWLTGLFGFHALITLLQFLLAFSGINNLWSSQVYNVVEVWVFLLVMAQWSESETMRGVLKWSALAYVVFWIAMKLFVERFDAYAAVSSPTSRIILVAAVSYVLFVLAKEPELPVLRDPRFWMAFALLVACTGSLTFYTLRTFIANLPMEVVYRAFQIHWGVVIVSNCLFSIGFLCKPPSLSSGGQLELAR